MLTQGLPFPYFAEVGHTAWERERERRFNAVIEKPWFTIHENFPPMRILSRNREVRVGRSFQRGADSRYRRTPEDPVGFALQHFHANRRMVAAVGEAMGIRTYHFVQPIRESPTEEQRERDAFFDALLAKPEGLYPIVDAIDGVSRPYVDEAGHYSDEGSFRVAAAMAEVIVEDQ